MPTLVWRVKLVAELQPGVTTEIEVARIERDADATLAELGLRSKGQAADSRAAGSDRSGTGDGLERLSPLMRGLR